MFPKLRYVLIAMGDFDPTDYDGANIDPLNPEEEAEAPKGPQAGLGAPGVVRVCVAMCRNESSRLKGNRHVPP